MSELLPGMEPASVAAAPLRDSSVAVLWRRTAQGPQLFWLKREQKLAFAGGFYALPGGKLDQADRAVPIEGATGLDGALQVAAARELFEEAGVLVARGPALTQAQRDAARRQLLDKQVEFQALLAAHGLALNAADFPPAGRWVTPDFLPVRFDTRFFLVEAPAGQHAEVWPGELSEGEWIAPRDALARFEAGTALLHPPSRNALESFLDFTTAQAALEALRNPPHCTADFVSERLEFQAGVFTVPLRTPTLPPATHTNAYVLGTGALLVVDPGSPDDAETDKLVGLLRARVAEGCRLEALVLTHHHGDHLGGARRLVEQLGLPLWAHARTADRAGLPVARLLRDGEVLALEGPKPMQWQVLHTPGHAAGHVCLMDLASNAVVAGDMVAGFGTIVIDPPEGDMAVYLAQLQRLIDVGARTLYPSHGAPIPDGPGKLNGYLVHRAWREQKVLAVLSGVALPLETVVERAYDDVASVVLPIAERNTLAILEKLAAEQKAAREGQGWLRVVQV